MNERVIIILLKLLLTLQINLVYLCLVGHLEKNKRWRNRRWLIRPINRRRLSLGFFANTFQELKQDPDLFFQITRMDLDLFNYLSKVLAPYLTKSRSNISAEQRLAITLKYLSSGDSILNIAVAFRIGRSTCYKIIKNSCEIIFKVLSPIYLNFPTKQQYKSIASGFLNDWNVPNCCGSIDGKHIRIKAPARSGALYYNYKKFYSFVLLAVCDHKYEFILFDIGALGSESDGGIFARSNIGKHIRDKMLDFPWNKNPLPGSNIELPYFFVGDDAFEITPHLMKPYTGKNLDDKCLIFNYRMSRARRVIENAFGILVSRWRFLEKPLGMKPKALMNCVLAAVCLHNFVMNKSRSKYCPPEFLDRENEFQEVVKGRWREEIDENALDDINEINFQDQILNAYQVRDTLADYFLSAQGQVPWQNEYIRRGSYQNV